MSKFTEFMHFDLKYFLERAEQIQILSLLFFSCSVMSNSLQPHGLQHARLPCPSPSSRACSNSCSLSQWCHPTISSFVIPFPPVFNLCQHQGLFQWVGSSYQVAKVLELQFWHQSFQWILTMISSRIDGLDLLAVQGTLKSLLQHYSSSKASILWHSVFFMVQLSHPYMTTGKTIALTIWTFLGKVISLLFSMMSRFVIFFPGESPWTRVPGGIQSMGSQRVRRDCVTKHRFVISFLPKSKHLLALWPRSLSTLILEPKKIKSVTVSIFFLYGCW